MSGVLDELFHWAALIAYVDAANSRRGWPECEEVRRRAFALYEGELREKNARRARMLDNSSTIGHTVETTPRRAHDDNR
jgi:hypothetical protein